MNVYHKISRFPEFGLRPINGIDDIFNAFVEDEEYTKQPQYGVAPQQAAATALLVQVTSTETTSTKSSSTPSRRTQPAACLVLSTTI
ncbi:hypothetical protein CL658_00010 [bacterium]|nr:hypothetical protein [bacterium]|tara:strand:+ start:526 stop:786 length:261 start_codon:yes stop_codon:yes gene_type:complete